MIINLQYVNMPKGMHGATTINEDGSYTVFLDARDADAKQLEAYLHELEHIKRGDLYGRSGKYIGDIECKIHGGNL